VTAQRPHGRIRHAYFGNVYVSTNSPVAIHRIAGLSAYAYFDRLVANGRLGSSRWRCFSRDGTSHHPGQHCLKTRLGRVTHRHRPRHQVQLGAPCLGNKLPKSRAALKWPRLDSSIQSLMIRPLRRGPGGPNRASGVDQKAPITHHAQQHEHLPSYVYRLASYLEIYYVYVDWSMV
jgi:hypothetical protein